MKRIVIAAVFIMALVPSQMIHAGTIEDFFNSLSKSSSESSLDDKTVISGLREALSIGTSTAVKLVAKENGYFGNETIKILLPEKIQIIGDVLRRAGFGRDVDAFILAMNRAAEKAAPKAKKVFLDAVREMTFQDAKRILSDGDTAATDYFKTKTSSHLTELFRPVVSSSMKDVGVARTYKAMTGKYLSLIPFANTESLDLDSYVTNKALDGLFHMVGQEEKKIRTNPAARTTELLRSVFGK